APGTRLGAPAARAAAGAADARPVPVGTAGGRACRLSCRAARARRRPRHRARTRPPQPADGDPPPGRVAPPGGARGRADADAETEDSAVERATKAVAAAIARHGGSGVRAGDGSFTAAFGAVTAREDDAVRAALAAVESLQAVAAVSESLATEVGVEVQIRIGI